MARGDVPPPYTVADMAEDSVGLLDALGIPSAHVVAISMGARIAREMALRHTNRVRSLVLIGSSSGAPGLSPPDPALGAAVGSAMTVDDREGWIEQQVAGWRAFSGGHGYYDEEVVRRDAAHAFDRAFYPEGLIRQRAATLADRYDHSEELRQLRVPTLVLHGRNDPAAPLEHAVDVARLVPGAELVILEDLGHELPPHKHRELTDAIVARARGASLTPAS